MISLNKARQKGNKRGSAGFSGSSRKVHAKLDAKVVAEPVAKTVAETVAETVARTKETGGGISGMSPDVENTGKLTFDDTRQEAGINRQGSERTKKRTETGTERGRFELMQYIHGFIALVLVLLAVIHIPFPEPFAWLPYSVAAALALITLKSDISIPVSRVLAIATTGMMFFFFALFFLVVPTLKAGWYTTQYGWAAVCLLLSAFVMIPILSDYSCRLKAECREARAARRTAFFSVPSHINPESR